MKLWLKFIIKFQLFCILLFDLTECNNKVKEKICDIKKFEDNIHSTFLSFAEKHKRYPENEQELDIWCRSLRKARRFVKKYADYCLKGFSKPTISVLAYHAGKTNKYFCENKQARKKFIDKGICGQRGKDGSIKCWNSVLAIVEHVKNITNSKDKLPSLCCAFYYFKDCVIDYYKGLYPRYCSAEDLGNVEFYLNRVAMDSFRMICSEYEDRDRCANYMDKLEMYGKSTVSPKYTTPFPVWFEILQTI